MGIVSKLKSLHPREVCEHGSQKAKCPTCELAAAEDRIALLEGELSRVRQAHQSIMNEILYGGTDLNDEPDIDRIHDFAKVGLRDMTAETKNT